jgi:hypothetical protein
VTRSSIVHCSLAVALLLSCARASVAQDTTATNDAPKTHAFDDDALIPAEPDFTLIALPTALRLPVHGSAFRVTHRFLRPLNDGDFGDLSSDFFGLDNGAQIGLEYRFGIIRNGQIGIHRNSDKTIEFFAQYGLSRQGDRFPVEISIIATTQGGDNFKDAKTPSLGAIVSRRLGKHAAFYIEPIWVNNSNPLPAQVVDHNDTFMVGLGTRIRIRPSVYVVAEAAPRPAGYTPGSTYASFAIEKHVGGHQFQLNFSNSFATTMGQIAVGGPVPTDWFLGFNISRKFF